MGLLVTTPPLPAHGRAPEAAAMAPSADDGDAPSEGELAAFEDLAAELARLAGGEIEAALGRALAVR